MFIPYNTAQQPRGLDYVLTKGFRIAKEGKVLSKTRTMGSDHDAWARHTEDKSKERRLLLVPRFSSPGGSHNICPYGDDEWLQQVSEQITKTRRKQAGFQESKSLKELRARAQRETERQPLRGRRSWKTRRAEKREYDKQLPERAIQRDWAALRQIRTMPRRQWQTTLLSDEDWKDKATSHFKGILPGTTFRKGKSSWTIYDNLRLRLLYMCKRTPVQLFGSQELAVVPLSWKRGKSTGPHGVSFEVIRGIFVEGEQRMGKMADICSDALCKGYLLNASDSVTTLPKTTYLDGEGWTPVSPVTMAPALLPGPTSSPGSSSTANQTTLPGGVEG